MARGTRIDIDDGWHHVMNRGIDHRQVFFTEHDGRMFLGLAVECTASPSTRGWRPRSPRRAASPRSVTTGV